MDSTNQSLFIDELKAKNAKLESDNEKLKKENCELKCALASERLDTAELKELLEIAVEVREELDRICGKKDSESSNIACAAQSGEASDESQSNDGESEKENVGPVNNDFQEVDDVASDLQNLSFDDHPINVEEEIQNDQVNGEVEAPPRQDVPDFQVFEFNQRRKMIKRLIVFTCPDRSKCYEYFCDSLSNQYYCYLCRFYHKISISVAIETNESGKEVLKYTNENQHKCSPIDFNIQNYVGKVLNESDFETFTEKFCEEEFKGLCVFVPDDKNLCFKYFLKNNVYECRSCRIKKATAKIYQKEDGQRIVELGKNEHQCKPMKYEDAMKNVVK